MLHNFHHLHGISIIRFLRPLSMSIPVRMFNDGSCWIITTSGLAHNEEKMMSAEQWQYHLEFIPYASTTLFQGDQIATNGNGTFSKGTFSYVWKTIADSQRPLGASRHQVESVGENPGKPATSAWQIEIGSKSFQVRKGGDHRNACFLDLFQGPTLGYKISMELWMCRRILPKCLNYRELYRSA